MIQTYTYLETTQAKLHEFVLAFFRRIEFETAIFSDDFYEKEFYNNLVKYHKGIIGKKFKELYLVISTWEQKDRSILCEAILRSNNIKEICEGKTIPWKNTDIPLDIREIIKSLFIDLYEKILKKSKDHFIPKYGSLLQHYQNFKTVAGNNLEYCPACGLVEMKTSRDKKRDQYDHYLPKDIYPFSSINFKNLIPICTDCNSFEVKSNKDILTYGGIVFYPFNELHKGIEIDVSISKNDSHLDKIKWKIKYSNSDTQNKEILAWKQIYDIEDRHLRHIYGNIQRWYGKYWEFVNDKDIINDTPDEIKRINIYITSIKRRKVLEYKTIKTLIKEDINSRAESKIYNRF